jgi:transposase
VLALHRVRELLIRKRTALINQMRGLLAESGILIVRCGRPGYHKCSRTLGAAATRRGSGAHGWRATLFGDHESFVVFILHALQLREALSERLW